METEELQSKTISYLRFPLTLGVIFIHFNLTNGISLGGAKFGIDYPEWYYWIISLFSDVLPRISVPLFFVISGFLFFYNCDFNSDSYLRKIKTRVRTLLVPYLLWNIIAIDFVICRCTVLKEPYEINISLGRILNTFFNNGNNNGIIIQQLTTVKEMPEPICGVLWYVREIMLMALITPVIYWLIKKCRLWVVIALGLIWIFDNILLPSSMHFFISAVCLYSAGSYSV